MQKPCMLKICLSTKKTITNRLYSEMFDYTLSYLQLNQITWKLDFRGRRELTCLYRFTEVSDAFRNLMRQESRKIYKNEK